MALRVLVTGSQGFLGRHVVAELLQSRPDAEVLGLGRSVRSIETFTYKLTWLDGQIRAPVPPGLCEPLAGRRYRYLVADLNDENELGALLEDFRPTVILHVAGALRDEPWHRLHESNVQAVISLFQSVARCSGAAPRIVLVSSGSVYGDVNANDLPIHEDRVCLPIDLYGASKRIAEDVARILSRQNRIPLIVARVFNLLGPGLQDRHLAASLARQIAAIQLGLASPVVTVGPLDTTRDFIEVGTAARALRVLAEKGAAGTVYNVASGRETPIAVLFQELVSLSGLTELAEIQPLPRRPSDISRVVADIDRLSSLGFSPDLEVGAALQEMLTYYTTVVARLT